MPDFSSLLKKPAGEAKKPPALPAADYPGVIKSFELGDNNKNKTPYVRLVLGLMSVPDGIDPSELEGIDITKRQQRRDFYITDDALWRLDQFIRSTGIEMNGREYEEVLPELVGTQVTIEIQQYLNQNTNEIGNQVGKIWGEHGLSE